MTPEQAAELRKAFPKGAIGKLPKPTKADNPKGNCNVCGKYHGLPAVHLDYVGHAATTDRLLQVDPEWSWEPMAYGPNGEPLMTNGGMWIWLTVAGVRRPGFGDGGTPKEIIGDAIRNAAMRFGVALDLWAKEDLHADEAPSEDARPKAAAKAKSPPPAAEEKNTGPTDDALFALLVKTVQLVEERGGDAAVFDAAVATARQKPDFAAWLQFQHDHWEEQPVASEFEKKAADAKQAGAVAQAQRAGQAQADRTKDAA